MGENILIDLKVDESIVGGATLICNNHYLDISIGSKVDEIAQEMGS